MPPNSNIAEFIEKALAAGVPHQTLVGMLAARGWPEKEIYEALADQYQRQTGIDVPRRAAAGASAKEAFFYLLIFSTLATWTVAFGCLAFTLIDRWLADPVFYDYQQSFDSYTITYSLAAMIVAFPLYLLISRIVVREAALHPEKLDSSVRKWLTYLALVIAACVFMGDLIAALAFLLRGELTSRFVTKSLVVLLLSGGVFSYYFGGLRKTDAAAQPGRDRMMAILSTVMVAVLVVIGFTQLGPPSAQRAYRADGQRVQRLYQLSTHIAEYWRSHDKQLPGQLTELPNASVTDPITRQPYEYYRGNGSQYQLCTSFARASDPHEATSPTPSLWVHPAGRHCFSLDAGTLADYPQQYP